MKSLFKLNWNIETKLVDKQNNKMHYQRAQILNLCVCARKLLIVWLLQMPSKILFTKCIVWLTTFTFTSKIFSMFGLHLAPSRVHNKQKKWNAIWCNEITLQNKKQEAKIEIRKRSISNLIFTQLKQTRQTRNLSKTMITLIFIIKSWIF